MPAPFTVRAARPEDETFILGLTERFVSFPLPSWREPASCAEGIRRDLAHHLHTRPEGSFLFVAEEATGTGTPERVGFVHLQRTADFFTGGPNCHISDVAVAHGADGRGVGRALLAFAEEWARQQGCERLSLSVFPGNTRARALYEQLGYGVELMRMVKPLA